MKRIFGALGLSALFTLGLALSISTPVDAYQISVKQKPGKLRFGVVEEDSLYAKAGIQRNDIIREINGKVVDDTTPISDVENVVRKGGKMTIERNGKLIKKNLKPMKLEDELIELPPPASE
ncbi:MAG: hypothetical protein KF767_15425 [Bdellovibrionaceae bacterium]|nr:hypothetical protein [Pseudobdellovibrionaceae bacterium]